MNGDDKRHESNARVRAGKTEIAMSQAELDAPQRMSDFDIELKLLLEAIYLK